MAFNELVSTLNPLLEYRLANGSQISILAFADDLVWKPPSARRALPHFTNIQQYQTLFKSHTVRSALYIHIRHRLFLDFRNGELN